MASSAFALAKVAAQIQNAGQLRAAMGAVASTLSEGYSKLGDISWIAGEKEAAQSLLDTVNKSAGILYNIYPSDGSLDDQDISTGHAISAGRVISEANDALKSVEQAANENLWDIATIVNDALSTVGKTVGGGLQAVVNAAASGGVAFIASAWPSLLLIGFGVVIFFWARARLIRKLVS
jgi:hypothetical protein